MSVKDELALVTPRLRRYARALTQASPAPSETADELVRATLLRMLDNGMPDRKADLLLELFSLLTQLNRDGQRERAGSFDAGSASWVAPSAEALSHSSALLPASKALCAALAGLKLDEREALFLVVVEGFTYVQAARILHISRASLLARLSRARTQLAEMLAHDIGAQLPGRRNPHLRVVK